MKYEKSGRGPATKILGEFKKFKIRSDWLKVVEVGHITRLDPSDYVCV